ncbi:PIN-like domain-containing protein [Hyphococcus lacteus]|uniref:VapC45 PIN like domain-containing protein n=1 Tax=Hyphococcus lacteus TaxID=3143536 RepID=A0ABV3Z7T0_9PROT
MKVVFDQNVPIGMVRVLRGFANERQFRKISGHFDIKAADDYAPKPGDLDYRPNDDTPWLQRFADDGGKVVISGDVNMRHRPHERLALIEHGFIVIFFEAQWSEWKFWRKCALLVLWWPEIATKVKRTKAKKSFFVVPAKWTVDGKLRTIPNKDPKLLKIERRRAVERSKKKKTKVAAKCGDGPLFEYADKATRKRKRKKDAKKKDNKKRPSARKRVDSGKSRQLIKKT